MIKIVWMEKMYAGRENAKKGWLEESERGKEAFGGKRRERKGSRDINKD